MRPSPRPSASTLLCLRYSDDTLRAFIDTSKEQSGVTAPSNFDRVHAEIRVIRVEHVAFMFLLLNYPTLHLVIDVKWILCNAGSERDIG